MPSAARKARNTIQTTAPRASGDDGSDRKASDRHLAETRRGVEPERAHDDREEEERGSGAICPRPTCSGHQNQGDDEGREVDAGQPLNDVVVRQREECEGSGRHVLEQGVWKDARMRSSSGVTAVDQGYRLDTLKRSAGPDHEVVGVAGVDVPLRQPPYEEQGGSDEQGHNDEPTQSRSSRGHRSVLADPLV